MRTQVFTQVLGSSIRPLTRSRGSCSPASLNRHRSQPGPAHFGGNQPAKRTTTNLPRKSRRQPPLRRGPDGFHPPTSHIPTGTRQPAAVPFSRAEQPQLPDVQTSSHPSPTSPALLPEGSPCSRHGCSKGEPPAELLQARSNAEQGHSKASHPRLGWRAALPSFLG